MSDRPHSHSLGILALAALLLAWASPTTEAAVPAMAPPAEAPWWWVAVAAPLLTGTVGVFAGYIAIRFDMKKISNQELVKRRIAIYDDIAPKLNDLLCFNLVVGAWKTLPPPAIIQKKRDLDRAIYVYGPLFSREIIGLYQDFIRTCFKSHTGPGRDAGLRADRANLRIHWGENWKPEWDGLFVGPGDAASPEAVRTAYDNLIGELAGEIGARRQARQPVPRRVAGNAQSLDPASPRPRSDRTRLRL